VQARLVADSPIGHPSRRRARPWGPALGLLLLAGLAPARALPPPDTLLARFEAVRAEPALRLPGQPLWLQSFEQAQGRMRGEVWAVLEHEAADAQAALGRPEPWCDALILHLNVKYCRAGTHDGAPVLDVGVGRKHDQPLAGVHWMRFVWKLGSARPESWRVALLAADGPLQTRDYRIELEAVALERARTLVHLTYSYAYGPAARWTMQLYLATLGHDKVGFTVVGRDADGQPKYVEGLRGVIERNAVRYALALQAYLGSLRLSAEPERLERRLQDWFDATERHALQLREIDRTTYLAMKRQEVRRQQQLMAPAQRD
jgi:hypothetical protein